MRRHVAVFLFWLLVVPPLVHAEEPVDWQAITRIKQEGFGNSRVMEIASYLTDVYGPRLTGSPNLRAASEWARDRFKEWGLANARLEPWGTFGRGWSVERFSIEMLEPQYMPIIAYPKAWTPGTNGPVTGQPVVVTLRSEEDFAAYRGKLRGAIVMLQPPRPAVTRFEPDARRHSEEDLKRLAQAPEPGARPPMEAQREELRAQRALQEKIARFLREEDVAVVLEPSRGEHGTIFVTGGGSYRANAEPTVPWMVVAIEHYARIARLLEKKIPVKLEVNIRTRFHDEDRQEYNVLAEIPGVDPKLKDEIVMLGAHLDSWHAGTGATDNAAGSAVVMEAVRILKAIGIQPRRTIRVALWTGEEQGLLGSRAYVEKYFGNPRTMELKPDHAKISVYFNLDNGTGRIRGIYLQGNDAVRPIFEAWLRPFHDLGATTVAIRGTGGTDHLAFDAVGIPAFQFIQDPIDYSTRTHHTNMDVYDRLLPGDLMQAAVIMASFVYHAAMREEKLPRKPLPKPQPGPPVPQEE
ncbi:Aminopeptidase S [bacterium HR08]|nr:Aminopeptidase S [bacterium HR08]